MTQVNTVRRNHWIQDPMRQRSTMSHLCKQLATVFTLLKTGVYQIENGNETKEDVRCSANINASENQQCCQTCPVSDFTQETLARRQGLLQKFRQQCGCITHKKNLQGLPELSSHSNWSDESCASCDTRQVVWSGWSSIMRLSQNFFSLYLIKRDKHKAAITQHTDINVM